MNDADPKAINRAARVLANRATSYFARLYGEEMETAPVVVWQMLNEHFELLTGIRSGLDPAVTDALEKVERARPNGDDWRAWADEIAVDPSGAVYAYEGGAYWCGKAFVPVDDFDGLRYEQISVVPPVPPEIAGTLQLRIQRPATAESVTPNPRSFVAEPDFAHKKPGPDAKSAAAPHAVPSEEEEG